MDTYGHNNAEDAEMAECDDDKVVTMMDVLKQQEMFEEDANAVLGASDDKNCTYSKGYIKRQALYACLTCCPEARVDPTKRAGVCLACSLSCHENHELIELYTRRNFRCDCGNPKFNSHPCHFTPDKTELNDGNTYNQNFSGLYCTCHRPYPDPESTFEDDMIQCTICEDWLHASHLEAVVPANDQYSEMICKNCMEKNEFLHDYSMYAVIVEADVDIVTGNGDTNPADLSNRDSEMVQSLNGIEENKTEIGTTSVTVKEDAIIDEGKVNSEDNATVSTDVKKDKENVAAETNKEIKQDGGNDESIEIKHEENADNEANKMDLDNASQVVTVEEQSEEISETNKPIKTEAPGETLKETNEDTLEKTNGTSNVAENAPIADPELIKDTKSEKPESTVENPDRIDEKMESTGNESEEADKITKEQNEEQNSKHSISDEVNDGNNVQGNNTDAREGAEQQLLTALTPDNPTSTEKTDADPEEKAETSAGSIKQSDDSINKKDVQINNEESPKKTVNASGDHYDEKPVVANNTATGNIEVPDTSQSEKDAKENAVEKTDSEMNSVEEETGSNEAKENAEEKTDLEMNTTDDLTENTNKAKESVKEETDSVINAMEELTENSNKPKEKGTENEEPTSESKENKEKADTIEAKESGNVEISASDKKLDDEVPEQTENAIKSNDKSSTNGTEDIEMGDVVIKTEPEIESKVDKPATDSENKSVSDENPVVTVTDNDSIKQESENLNETVDTLKIEDKIDSELKNINGNDSTNITEPKHDNEVTNVPETGNEHKRKMNTSLTDDTSPKKAKKVCVRPKPVSRVLKGATFWPSTFRQKLCTCAECLSMYKDLKVLFLTDQEDTVFAYESLGKANAAGGASQYEKGMQALSSLDRVQQINALSEYTRMRDKLLLYLKSFRDRKEVVKEEDIRAFFAGMKPRRERDGVYFLS